MAKLAHESCPIMAPVAGIEGIIKDNDECSSLITFKAINQIQLNVANFKTNKHGEETSNVQHGLLDKLTHAIMTNVKYAPEADFTRNTHA